MSQPSSDKRLSSTGNPNLPPSIRRASSSRQNLLVFEIDGQLHTLSMQWMAGEISDAYETQGVIDILLLFKPFKGATLGAVFEPNALKAEAAAIAHVRRYAVVGAPGGVEAMINLGDKISPVDAATFSDAAEARVWIDRP